MVMLDCNASFASKLMKKGVPTRTGFGLTFQDANWGMVEVSLTCWLPVLKIF